MTQAVAENVCEVASHYVRALLVAATPHLAPDERSRLDAITDGAGRRTFPVPEIAWLVEALRTPQVLARATGRTVYDLAASALAPRGAELVIRASAAESRSPSSWCENVLARLVREINAATDAPGAQLGAFDSEAARELVEKAVRALELLWPEQAHLFDLAVSDVVLFHGSALRSGTGPYGYGAIFFQPKPRWTLPFYLDSLVHELGHLLLFARSFRTPLVATPGATVYSALRRTQRSAEAALHAAYVCGSICEALARYVDRGRELALPAVDDALILLASYTRALASGISAFDGSGALSSLGASILDELRATHASLDKARRTRHNTGVVATEDHILPAEFL